MKMTGNRKTGKLLSALLALLLAALALCPALTSCEKEQTSGVKDPDGTVIEEQSPDASADETVKLPEDEDKSEAIEVNEDYAADPERLEFEGTIDEIYEDGSMLIYSPFFFQFDYKVIVETDENTDLGDFVPKENQCVLFKIYSTVKRSEPLTVVAESMSLAAEVSDQREKEAERQQRIADRVAAIEGRLG